jgi:hypothetical protein
MNSNIERIDILGKAINSRNVLEIRYHGSTTRIQPLLCGMNIAGVVELIATQVSPHAPGQTKAFLLDGIEKIDVLEEKFNGGIRDDLAYRLPFCRIYSMVQSSPLPWLQPADPSTAPLPLS